MANANETLKVLDRVLNQSNLIFYRHSQFSFWVSEIFGTIRKTEPTIIHISMDWHSFLDEAKSGKIVRLRSMIAWEQCSKLRSFWSLCQQRKIWRQTASLTTYFGEDVASCNFLIIKFSWSEVKVT